MTINDKIKASFSELCLWLRAVISNHPGIAASIILHIVIFVALFGGLPNFFEEKPRIIKAVSIDMVQPKKEPLIVKKDQPKPVIKKVEAKKSPIKKIVRKPKAPKPTPKPVKKVTKKAPKPKPIIKKSEPEETLESVLKTLEDDIEQSPQTAPIAQEPLDSPLSYSELSSIIKQISDNWSMVLTGTGDVKDIAVELRLSLNKDGSVKNVRIIDKARYNKASETFFRAAADSAVRATYKASPLRNLSLKKYSTWKEMEITFHPE